MITYRSQEQNSFICILPLLFLQCNLLDRCPINEIVMASLEASPDTSPDTSLDEEEPVPGVSEGDGRNIGGELEGDWRNIQIRSWLLDQERQDQAQRSNHRRSDWLS